MSLSVGATANIQNTRREFIEQTMADLRRYFAKDQWLAENNRYRSNAVKKFREDFVPNGNIHPTKKTNLSHYIASSAQMHCIDGWSYLSSSIAALVRGDSYAAVHLAYYAELRAAMSILASDGIGVLNQHHCALTDAKKAERIPGVMGTHVFAWLAIKEWSEKGTASDLISDSVVPFGIPLRDWFATLPGSYTLQPLARSWIRDWGVDLQRLADQEQSDRSARNEVSYRPTALLPSTPVPAEDAVRLTEQLWELCEPTGSSKFGNLDKRLLRISMRAVFSGRNTATGAAEATAYQNFVSSLVNAQSISSVEYREEIQQYLLKDEDTSSADILQIAKARISDPQDAHLGVVCRAFLLLRIAAGTVDLTLRNAGVLEDELKFWKDRLLAERGFSDPNDPPENLSDLWQDVDDELSDLRQLLANGQAISFNDLRNDYDRALLRLADFDAVPLWALARV